ncbi:facilitated trehalose transporter Tret1-like [Ostrinia furnacalis]|uniref:facilitated trehalose transporter Tret1-like n=1 Tax=Ostrinia furnacalis TaxID=93504 RepID=UPI00103CEA52|nr:facilitated trehalose transporter Tret1-like [Ostrinia furnacalis]
MPDYLWKQLGISLCVYVGQILVGYCMGWTAPVIVKLQNPDETPLSGPISDAQASWVASVIYIGTITGPYVSGYLSNKRGRKLALFLGGFVTLISFIVLATAVNMSMLLAGRIFVGFGTGIMFVTNFVYLGEIASTNIRGLLLTGTAIFTTFGTLLVYSTGPYISFAATSYIGVALTVLYIVGICLIPETPNFYVMKGQEKQAQDTLIFLGRDNEVSNVLSTKKEEESFANELKELLTIKGNRKALSITLTLNILQQMSGVVVVILFATRIFELAGSTIQPNLATIIIGVTQLVSSIICSGFVERVGRKVLLLWSTAACFLTLSVLGTYFYLDHLQIDVEVIGWLPLVCLVIYFLAFELGFGIIPGTFTGEMFRSNVRSTGSAITITVAWLFGFGLSSAFGYMIEAIGGHFTFWIFGAACLIAFVYTIFFVPETRGKTLVEIQEMLN